MEELWQGPQGEGQRMGQLSAVQQEEECCLFTSVPGIATDF